MLGPLALVPTNRFDTVCKKSTVNVVINALAATRSAHESTGANDSHETCPGTHKTDTTSRARPDELQKLRPAGLPVEPLLDQ